MMTEINNNFNKAVKMKYKVQPMMTRLRQKRHNKDRATAKAFVIFSALVMVASVTVTALGV